MVVSRAPCRRALSVINLKDRPVPAFIFYSGVLISVDEVQVPRYSGVWTSPLQLSLRYLTFLEKLGPDFFIFTGHASPPPPSPVRLKRHIWLPRASPSTDVLRQGLNTGDQVFSFFYQGACSSARRRRQWPRSISARGACSTKSRLLRAWLFGHIAGAQGP